MSDIKIIASKVFKTDDGKLLLEHLSAKFYDNRIKPDSIDRQIGRRDVVLYLKQLIKGE